jgi:transposase
LLALSPIQRFENADKLAGYAGLDTRVHASGASYHSGKITKQGCAELRHILIEVAWAAVQNSDIWRQQYQKISQRRGSQKAIVAIAPRILVVVWHVWQKQEPSRYHTKGNSAQVHSLGLYSSTGSFTRLHGQTIFRIDDEQD